MFQKYIDELKMMLLFVVLVASITASQGHHCKDQCGTLASLDGAPCYCDAVCERMGDCCLEKQDVCGDQGHRGRNCTGGWGGPNCDIPPPACPTGFMGPNCGIPVPPPVTGDMFICPDGSSIRNSAVCDGQPDCVSEDEMSYNMGAQWEIFCPIESTMLPPGLVGDGIPDCIPEDENPHICATPDQYVCGMGAQIIPRSWLCDGDNDCMSADEDPHLGNWTQTDTFVCPNGKTIEGYLVNNGMKDCDSEDEEGWTCAGQNDFVCPDGSLIPELLKCNGMHDCKSDDEQEWACNDKNNGWISDYFYCGMNQQVSVDQVCNGINDCISADEDIWLCKKPEDYVCMDGVTVIHENLTCNGENDCPSEDEMPWNANVTWDVYCPYDMKPIDKQYVNDGNNDCRSDDEEVYMCASPDEFVCGMFMTIINRTSLCDGHNDCPTEDEFYCDEAENGTTGNGMMMGMTSMGDDKFYCWDGNSIPIELACDGKNDCRSEDEQDWECNYRMNRDTARSIASGKRDARGAHDKRRDVSRKVNDVLRMRRRNALRSRK